MFLNLIKQQLIENSLFISSDLFPTVVNFSFYFRFYFLRLSRPFFDIYADPHFYIPRNMFTLSILIIKFRTLLRVPCQHKKYTGTHAYTKILLYS